MARKPATRVEFTLFDVVYEDSSQRSNRRVPSEVLGGLDGDAPARAIIEEQVGHRGEVRHSGHCCEKRTSIRQQKTRRGHAIVAIRISIGLMMGHYFMVECDLTWPIESSSAPKQGGDVA